MLAGAATVAALWAVLGAADAEVAARLETRSTTMATRALTGPGGGVGTESRVAVALTPRVSGLAEGMGVRATAEYAPRLWTSEAGAQPTPLVNHDLTLRAETRLDGRWRAEASAAGTRGTTDPLASQLRMQVADTAPFAYESLRVAGRGELRLDPRTTLRASAAAQLARGSGASAREQIPTQRSAAGEVTAERALSPRNGLRIGAAGSRTATATPVGDALADVFGVVGTWRRRVSPLVEGWVGAGAALTREAPPGDGGGATTRLLPACEVGGTRSSEPVGPALTVMARVAPFVDRYSGQIATQLDAVASVNWPLSERLALTGTSWGGARADLLTRLGGVDVRAVWLLRRGIALEAGLVARAQYEERPEFPSFVEGGLVLAVTARSGRLFGTLLP